MEQSVDYWRGCREFQCRVSYANYQRFRYAERSKGRKGWVKSERSKIAIQGIGTQDEIAELLGIGQATVSRILAGKKIRPSTEAKILRAA